MKTNSRVWLCAAIWGTSAFLGAGSAHAQRTAVAVAPRPAAVHARPVSARTKATAHAAAKSPAAASTRQHSGISSNSLFSGSFAPFNPIGSMGFGPSFGFAGGSLANRDLAIEAAIDPATEWRLFEAQKFARNFGFAGTGYYLLHGGYYEALSDNGEPNEAVEQSQGQQAGANAPEQQAGEDAEGSAQSETQGSSKQSPEDVGQFVLALRNGTQIQTVAFSRANDRIIYITSDGLRRTLPLADIDIPSTVQINDERGTPLQFPL